MSRAVSTLPEPAKTRRSRRVLALVTLATAWSLLGAAPLQQGTAALSDEAKLPAPNVPQPAPFQKAKGFSAAELAPYRDVLGAADLAQLARLSEELFSAPGFAAFRQVAEGVAENKRREEQYAKEFEEKETLFSYAIPNDPSLRLGTGKSRGGKVTSLPRLLAGALDAKPKSPQEMQDEKEDADSAVFENFLLRSPEQVCTAGLSYSLNPEGSGFAGIEYMPPPLPMDDPLMRMLLFIENNPSPIYLTEDEPTLALADPEHGGGDAPPTVENNGRVEGESDEPDYGGPYGAIMKKARKAEVPLHELTAAFSDKKASQYSPGHVQKLAAFFRALEEAAVGLKKDCLGKGNRWTEVKQINGELNLVGCITPKGTRTGIGATVTGEAFPWAGQFTLQNFDPKNDLAVQLALDTSDMALHLTALKGEKPVKFGPELTYDATGPAVALNFNVPEEHLGKWGEYDVYEWHGDGGKLKMIGHRKGGVPVDERSYYADGSLAGHVTFEGGHLTSYREWFENKIPAEETFFDKGGNMHGARRWWHKTGRQAGEITYANGRPDGDMAMWYDAGKLGVRATYKKGEMNGDVKWFYEDGGALYEGRFKDDKPDGTVKVTLANGVVVSERTFKKGEPEGTWVTYDANGKPAQEFSFKKGQKEGKAILKYPNGEPAVELVWKDGQLEGALNSYFQGGQMAATCTYEHDRLVAFVRYHKTGEQAMDGKVLDQEKGLGQFTTFRVNATPIVSCGLDNWEPKACRVFNDKGKELPLPTYKTLVANIEASSGTDEDGRSTGKKMKWRPEKCGGYEMKLNFDPLIDYGQDLITVDISTKQACKGEDLAEVLYCSITLEGGKLRTDPCSMAGGDEGDLQDIITEMDGGDPRPPGNGDEAAPPRQNIVKTPGKPAAPGDDPWAPDNEGYGPAPGDQQAAEDSPTDDDQPIDDQDVAPPPLTKGGKKPLPAHH